MEEKEGKDSFNGKQFKVIKIEKNKFYIGDTTKFNKYIKNGVAK